MSSQRNSEKALLLTCGIRGVSAIEMGKGTSFIKHRLKCLPVSQVGGLNLCQKKRWHFLKEHNQSKEHGISWRSLKFAKSLISLSQTFNVLRNVHLQFPVVTGLNKGYNKLENSQTKPLICMVWLIKLHQIALFHALLKLVGIGWLLYI